MQRLAAGKMWASCKHVCGHARTHTYGMEHVGPSERMSNWISYADHYSPARGGYKGRGAIIT